MAHSERPYDISCYETSKFELWVHVRLTNSDKIEIMKNRLGKKHEITEEEFERLAEMAENFTELNLVHAVKEIKNWRFILEEPQNPDLKIDFKDMERILNCFRPRTRQNEEELLKLYRNGFGVKDYRENQMKKRKNRNRNRFNIFRCLCYLGCV